MFLYTVHLSCVNLNVLEIGAPADARCCVAAVSHKEPGGENGTKSPPRGLCRDLIIIPGANMIRRVIGIAAVVAALAVPALAHAQGVPGGIERGAREGERAAGPV